MKFDRIIHATQYYRAPTPKKDEWEFDISRLSDISLDTFQIRINWRWNERVEGLYDFSDVDELFDLAEKYNKKVIIKFLLECAPQYVFDKYGGTVGRRARRFAVAHTELFTEDGSLASPIPTYRKEPLCLSKRWLKDIKTENLLFFTTLGTR